MPSRRHILSASASLALATLAQAQTPSASSKNLFAVEFRTGPKWDAAKPPNEQAFFKEHSANLGSLRKAGRILIGARYSDKGFLIFTGESEADVRALIEADPAVQNQTFSFELHRFNVFYPGCV
jgi:uncharacterized protein YciI